jgi:hypothetical protein
LLPSRQRAMAIPLAEGAEDWKISVSLVSGKAAEFSPKPESGIVADSWRAAPAVACDSLVDRVYFGHPLLGYVAAFRPDGEELWRVSIPSFRQIGNATSLRALTFDDLRGLEGKYDTLGRIIPSGPFLLIEFRTPTVRSNNMSTITEVGSSWGRLGHGTALQARL